MSTDIAYQPSLSPSLRNEDSFGRSSIASLPTRQYDSLAAIARPEVHAPTFAPTWRRTLSNLSRRKGGVRFRDEVEVREAEPGLREERSHTSTPWDGTLLLTLDGEGIRGLSTLVVLELLMEAIEVEEKRLDPDSRCSADSPRLGKSDRASVAKWGYLPSHYFDFIGGTSTGGLLAIMLGRLRMDVKACWKWLEQLNAEPESKNPFVSLIPFPKPKKAWSKARYDATFDQILSERSQTPRSPPASPTNSRALQHPDTAGAKGSSEKAYFKSSSSRCKTIAIALRIDGSFARPYVFRSYSTKPQLSLRRTPTSMSLKNSLSVENVAKAIMAPPSKPFEIDEDGYVDASTYARNPTVEIFHEVERFERSEAIRPFGVGTILSIGVESKNHNKARDPLIKALARTTEKVDERIHLLMGGVDDRYCRIKVPALFNDKAQGTKPLVELRKDSKETIHELKETRERIGQMARDLVRRRKERAITPAWESFALGVTYTCSKPGCTDKKFEDRQSLLRHWIRKHGYDYPDPSTIDEVEAELDDSQKFDES